MTPNVQSCMFLAFLIDMIDIFLLIPHGLFLCCSVTLERERFAAVKARAGRRTRSEKYGRNTIQEALLECDPTLFKR